jgi:hypothetical protein
MLATITTIRFTKLAMEYVTGDTNERMENANTFWQKWVIPLKTNNENTAKEG